MGSCGQKPEPQQGIDKVASHVAPKEVAQVDYLQTLNFNVSPMHTKWLLTLHKHLSNDASTMSLRFILNWYLSPCRLEQWRCGRVYELIGMRTYKKYLPTSGDLVTRWRGVRRISAFSGSRYESLLQHRRFTIEYEIRHFVGGAIMLVISLLSVTIWKKGDLFVLVVVNMLINGYPLLLQRYNRVRIDNVLNRTRDI